MGDNKGGTKITILGAGNVGATVAYTLAVAGTCTDIVLIDINKEKAKGEEGSKRAEIKALIAELKKTNPAVEMNIFRSPENVNLRTLISYHDGDEYHHFLDDYK